MLTVMKRYAFKVAVAAALVVSAGLHGQTAEKSSGVIRLDMKKPPSTRSNEASAKVVIPMEQKTPVELNGEINGFTWIAPTLSSVKTPESV